MKTPEQEIADIIRDRKLIDAAEIIDLENLILQCQQAPGEDARFNRENFRRHELLTKILKWIKP